MGVMRSSALWSPSFQARSSMLISQGARCSGSISGIACPLKYTAKPGDENFLTASDRFRVRTAPGIGEEIMKSTLTLLAAGSLFTTLAIAQTYTVRDLGVLKSGNN